MKRIKNDKHKNSSTDEGLGIIVISIISMVIIWCLTALFYRIFFV